MVHSNHNLSRVWDHLQTWVDYRKKQKQQQTISLGSKITADSDRSHEIKRRLLPGSEAVTNLDSVLKKQRQDFANKATQSKLFFSGPPRGFPNSSVGKEFACHVGDLVSPWVGKIPWRRGRLPTPVFWPGESHGLYAPWGQSRTQLSDFHFHSQVAHWERIHLPIQVRSLGQEDPWRRKWQPTPVFLLLKSLRQRSLACYSSRGQKKNQTRLSD